MGGGAAPEWGGAQGAGAPEGGRAGVINTPLATPSHSTAAKLTRENHHQLGLSKQIMSSLLSFIHRVTNAVEAEYRARTVLFLAPATSYNRKFRNSLNLELNQIISSSMTLSCWTLFQYQIFIKSKISHWNSLVTQQLVTKKKDLDQSSFSRGLRCSCSVG